ncbi:MAG: hypothetical protein QME65_04950 [Candidatus Omnitrophota bacterium]|nr:hypothetical protein [Candidatus Omnitrophota bacterium]
MFKIFAVYSIVPVVVLLAISFFVLLAARRAEKDRALKLFGYTVAALLWLTALVVFSTGVYVYSRGYRAMNCMGKMKMHGPMPSMMPQQEKGQNK